MRREVRRGVIVSCGLDAEEEAISEILLCGNQVRNQSISFCGAGAELKRAKRLVGWALIYVLATHAGPRMPRAEKAATRLDIIWEYRKLGGS